MISRTRSGMFLMGMGEFTLPIHLAHAPILGEILSPLRILEASKRGAGMWRPSSQFPSSGSKAVRQRPPRNIYLPDSPSSHPSATPNTSHSKHTIPPNLPAHPLHQIPCPVQENETLTPPTFHPSLPSLSNIKSHATRAARRPRVVAGVTMAGDGGGQELGSGIVAEGVGWGWERQRPSIRAACSWC